MRRGAVALVGLLLALTLLVTVPADPAHGVAKSGDTKFNAATWNVYYRTPAKRLAPILDGLLRTDVSILLMQEAGGRDIGNLLRSRGLRTFAVQQWRVAWDPHRWRSIDRHALTLSTAKYYSKTTHRWQATRAAAVTLVDRTTGKTLEALSYHTPAAVQRAVAPPNRLVVLRQAMAALGARAHQLLTGNHRVDAILDGGDDNVDERGAHGPWGFMRMPVTGLRLVQAPSPTHAGGRRIDDFRTRGLVPGRGATRPGGGDHRIQLRDFRWGHFLPKR